MKVREDCTPKGRRYDQPRVFLVTGVKDDTPLTGEVAPHLEVLAEGERLPVLSLSPAVIGYAFPQEPVLLVPCSLFLHLMKVHNMPHLVLGCRGRDCGHGRAYQLFIVFVRSSGPPDRIG
ncbi:hypothetical protein GWK47_019141 [Chionoecetes opilio]|uniref:Uncharacterized protein n=1 Tax=Chionoecetes opilio TaxID=41210 RepID=A0A8J5CLE7_CHIOP|nr:hypothetical protein GWK47_019141 [Chionoecetes opilio]